MANQTTKIPLSSSADPLLHSPPYGIPIRAQQEPYIVLLPYYRRPRRPQFPSSSSLLAIFSLLVVLSLTIFLLWPSNPQVRLARLTLRSINFSINKRGTVTLDFNLDLKIRVSNRDFYSLDYGHIIVGIGYRGRSLGSLKTSGGRVRAKGVSYLDAELRLSGIRVLEDAFFLIEDLARGSVLFDASTELVDGELHIFGIDLPIEGRVTCSVNVDAAKQTIASQDCYPEVSGSLIFLFSRITIYSCLSLSVTSRPENLMMCILPSVMKPQ